MRERVGNIWDYVGNPKTAIVVTTNGCIDKKGEAVMGAGIARQAKERYPMTARRLGNFLSHNALLGEHREDEWNIPYLINRDPLIFSFPTKPARVVATIDNLHIMEEYRNVPKGTILPGWKAMSDLKIIERSAILLVQFVKPLGLKEIVLPQPGCGHGGLDWIFVDEVIRPIFDDRFLILYYERKR